MNIMDKKILNYEGQAIFEFIVFLPIILILYGIIIGIGASINGSINQQKATRGFAMARFKGDPYIPIRRQIVEGNSKESIVLLGMTAHVYAERVQGETPVAACFRMPIFGLNDEEECNASPDEVGDTSPLIRVKTAFGICGTTYIFDPTLDNRIVADFSNRASSPIGCLARDTLN